MRRIPYAVYTRCRYSVIVGRLMPITNVFNEWWAATTSKKLRAVRIKNAKEGKNGMSHSPYGYTQTALPLVVLV